MPIFLPIPRRINPNGNNGNNGHNGRRQKLLIPINSDSRRKQIYIPIPEWEEENI